MSDNGSGMNAIVAVVAVIAIAIVGYFAVMMLRNQENNGAGINVDLGGDVTNDGMGRE